MPLFNQEIRSKQSTRTKIGRVVRAEGGYVDVVAVGGNTVIQKVKTGGLSPNVGDYVTIVFHSDGEKQAIPISSKEQVTSSSSVMASGSSGGGGAFTAGNGLSTTVGGVTNVNVVSGRTQITSNAVDVSTSLLPTPLVGEIGRVAYVSATGQLSYSSTLSLNGVQVIISGTSARIMGDFSSSPRVNRTLFQSSTTNGASNVGAVPNGSGTSSAFTSFGAQDPDNSKGIQISGTSTEAFVNAFQTSSGTLSALALLFKINSAEAARFTANKAFLVGKTSQALPDSIGNAEFNDSVWIGNLLKIAGATGGLATIQAQATVTPTLTLPSSTGTLALLSDIPASVSGTIHYIPKFTGSNVIGNSHLFLSGTDIKTTTANLYMISERTSANSFASFGAFSSSATYTAEAYFYAYSSSYGTAGISAFSNGTLTYVSVSGHLLPGSDASQDLGSASSRWRSLYAKGSINIYGATSGNVSIVAPAVAGTPTLTLPTTTGTLALTSDLSAYVPLAGGVMTGALGIGRTPGTSSDKQLVFPQGSSGVHSPGIRFEGGQTDGGLAMNDGILEFWNNWRAYCSNVSGRFQGIFRFDTRSGYESEAFTIGGTLNDNTTDFMAVGINYANADVYFNYYGIGATAVGVDTMSFGIGGKAGWFGVKYTIKGGGGLILRVVNTDSNYSITETDYTINVTDNAPDVTLPDATIWPGQIYEIKNSGSGGSATVKTTSSQTIDGSGAVGLNQWDRIKVQSDGYNWIIL